MRPAVLPKEVNCFHGKNILQRLLLQQNTLRKVFMLGSTTTTTTTTTDIIAARNPTYTNGKQRYHYHDQIRFVTAVAGGASSSSSSSSSPLGKKSTTTTASISKRPQEKRRRKRIEDSIHFDNIVQKMLQSELGTFDSRAWHEAEWTMKFLNRQRTVKSVNQSLDLLDRFLKEYCFQCKNRNNNNKPTTSSGGGHHHQEASSSSSATPPVPVVLTTASLDFTVNNWQICARNLETPEKRSDAIPNPSQMLSTIDYFREYYKSEPAIFNNITISSSSSSSSSSDNYPQQHIDNYPQQHIDLLPLQPDIYTYSMIIDALAFSQQGHTTAASAAAGPAERDHNNNNADGGQSINESMKPDIHGNHGWYFESTPAPVIAEMILNRLLEESKSNPNLAPSVVIFNSVINSWSRSRLEDGPEKAFNVLRRLQNFSSMHSSSSLAGLKYDKNNKNNNLTPDNSTYGTIMQVFSNSKTKNAAERAEQLLEEIKQSSSEHVYPTSKAYLGVLKAWGRSDHPQAGEFADQRLQELISLYLEQLQEEEGKSGAGGTTHTTKISKANDLVPKAYCFLAVMNIYATKGDAAKTTALLEQMQRLYESTGRNPDLCPTVDVFNCVLKALGRSQSKEVYSQTEAIIQRMSDLAETTGNSDLYPNGVTFIRQLHALSKSDDVENALLRANNILRKIHESPHIQPTVNTYNVYLHLLAKSNRSNAAEQAERILRRMWDLYRSNAIDFTPDTISYNTAIDACRNDPQKAEALFRDMQNHWKETGRRCKPNRVSYGSLITAWARSNRPDKAQNLFDEMIHDRLCPSTVEYNTTIHAWATQGDADQAEQMLNRCLQDYRSGNKAAKPNVKTFSSVINALAKRRSSTPWKDAKRAEAILMRMEELSQALGDEVKPNVYSFNAVLDCFSWCKDNADAPEHAEKILKHMHILADSGNLDVMPNVISYTSVMNSWVKSNSPDAPDRVEMLLRDLMQRYETSGDESLKPSQHTFNFVIGAHARNLTRDDSLEKAMAHFDRMVEQYTVTGDPDWRPGPMHFSAIMTALSKRGMSVEAEAFMERILQICKDYCSVSAESKKLEITSSFNGLIGAIAKSRVPGSAVKAEKVLRRMQNLDPVVSNYAQAPPNVYSYTSVMMAHSLVSDPSEKALAVENCERLLFEMLERARGGDHAVIPNAFTFGTLLQVIARSNLPDKAARAQRVWETMLQHGVRPDKFVKTALDFCLRA